jgi:alpha-beta hydrolase superfamily lysophospholipase
MMVEIGGVMELRTFVDAHGVEISTRWWHRDGATGTVVISHGASEHGGRYDRFARALNQAGYNAAAIEHRGHGLTGAATGAGVMGPGGGDAVVEDLERLRGMADADAPVFLFGHSMGALIALAHLTRHSAGLAGAVLCGFAADPDGTAAVGELLHAVDEAGLREQPYDGLADNNAPFEPARTPYDWLSRDPDEVDRYIADPLCCDDNKLTYGYLIDLFDVVAPARDRIESITCPVLVIAGDHDPAAGMGAHATALAAALERDGVTTDLTLYPGARHELLNETNRDQVTADIIDWLDAHH